MHALESSPDVDSDWDQLLRDRFGLPSFHDWQRDAIEELVHGRRRVLVVAPTGGGKSLCYQFPATLLGGTTIVVSPLIALMEDQVRSLTERGIPATFLASTLDLETRRAREAAIRRGAYRLVYVAPERLASGAFVSFLAALRPPLCAIDEAHCISQWGHDFRPDYLRLGAVLEALAPGAILACTATATPVVRSEILERLGLDEGGTRVVLRGFARPNLHLSALELDGSARRKAAVSAIRSAIGAAGEGRGAAIVYAATRRGSERLATKIADLGYRAAAYHAGLPAAERAEVNARFAAGGLEVVCATNAFGMGIDRSDIRVVVHIEAPGSIEAYYQEVGRAGRDGQPAFGLLLSGSADFGVRKRLVEAGRSDAPPPDPAVTKQKWQLFLDLMRYVEAGSCRHDFILRYFGDEQELLGGCGHCDVCERLDALRDEHGEPELRPEDALVVRKALSGIARNRGVMGLNAVAEMLHGDDNDRLQKSGLTQLSTHGLLRAHDRPWIVALLRRLITAGLVDLTVSDYPKPYLTSAGVECMKGERPVRVLLPPPTVVRSRSTTRRDPERAPQVEALTDAADLGLFERLREARLAFARDKGVPAYVICHDRTLIEIARMRPATLEQLSRVHGMGPARLCAYGEGLLSAVKAR